MSAPRKRAAGTEIGARKAEHLDIVLSRGVRTQGKSAGFDLIDFEHCALPELDLDAIDLASTFLGRALKAPILISSMTGGPQGSASINLAIAQAAGRLGIGFAVGSQRIALESAAMAGFDRQLRDAAGPVPILANFGAAQLRRWNVPEMARRAVDMIDADGLIIHLNPLQEAVQEGGDRDWSGLLGRIEALARAAPKPVIVKEVGSGISGALARRLWDAGVSVLDVAGAGGTNWAAVEAERAQSPRARAVADAFRGWGIPTAEALRQVSAACPQAVIIASGGIRDGVDAAKALALGAALVGQAAGVLPAALAGADAVAEHMAILIEQLRVACFCTGSEDLSALRRARLLPIDSRAGATRAP